MQSARSLISNGLKQCQGPITLDTPSGPRIILPSSLHDWVKSNKSLDHKELVYHDFFGSYPGFEANAALTSPDNIVIDTIKKKMSQNGKLVPIISEHVEEALSSLWGNGKEWHELSWVPDTMGLVSRAAASVFVGPQLARTEEWQSMTMAYAGGFFSAAFELKRWPAWTRWVVHWFLPGARTCRGLMSRVRNVVNAEIERRAREDDEVEYHDAITWSQEIAGNDKTVDHGAIQLAFAMAALHTTSEALRQVLLDICQHSELVEPLRNEIEKVVSTSSGLTLAALANLHLLDSVMKESQRLSPPAIVGLERLVVRDTHLPDGTLLPRGSIIAVDSSDMWSPKVHSDPDVFDGYRFFRMREAGDGSTSFVSSTKEHNVFGGGRHICPGRFLASVEIKLCLVHILLKYDVRLAEGCVPKTIKNGLFQMVDPMARVEVKKRAEEETFFL